MSSTQRICLIDDDESTRTSLADVLALEGYDVSQASDGAKGFELAQRERFHVVLTDVRMPGIDGLQLVESLHRVKPNLPIIVMTGHGTTETAIEATRRGAFEYLLKPFEIEELLSVLDKAVAAARSCEQPIDIDAELLPDVADRAARARLVGRSRAMQAVYKEVGRIADKPITALILGETGTGKELVARALYQHSDRADKSFIAVNCAAIPDTLLESELFGHERGAFTGADARRIGRFEQADSGTLFLDEIGDLSVNTQAKLLRVLQDRVVTRLGGREALPVNVRIIAATHRDLGQLVSTGKFREDLYYRLAVVTIRLPALRERPEDIAPLVSYFLWRHGPDMGVPEPAIAPAALEWLSAQPWPGNVRQLENAARQALLLARHFTIQREHVEQASRATITSSAAAATTIAESLPRLITARLDDARNGRIAGAEAALIESMQRELYAQAIAQAGGNLTQAARWIGITRLTLRERMSELGLRETPASKQSEVKSTRE